MADAMETARQIAKTHDDCLCEGADTATLVSRIEAHVLAYAAEAREAAFQEFEEYHEQQAAEAEAIGYINYTNRHEDLAKAMRNYPHRVRSSSPAKDDGNVNGD